MNSMNNNQVGGEEIKKGLRSFTCEKIRGQPCHANGRYLAKTPVDAARKAFSSYCKRNNRGARCVAHLSVRETTRGSKKKLYAYNATRRVLKGKDKKTITLPNGVNLTYKYKTEIHSTPVQEYNKKN